MKNKLYNLQLMIGNLSSDIMSDAEKHDKELKRIRNLVYEIKELNNKNKLKNKRLCESKRDFSFITSSGEMLSLNKGDILEYKDHGTVQFLVSDDDVFLIRLKEKDFHKNFTII